MPHAKRPEGAGYRPCRRYKPDQPPLSRQQAGTVADICRFIEASEHMPPLAELATRAGLSPYHFHRLFKQVTGLTPRAFATAHRCRCVRNRLTTSRTVTDAIYEAGYRSSGRFYGSSNGLLGMTPSNYHAGGAGTDIRFAVGDCSLGSILVAMSERGICAIFLGNDPDVLTRDLQDRFPRARLIGGDRRFERMVARIIGFVESPTCGLDLLLAIQGTAFQQRVWEALRKIPPGMSVSSKPTSGKIWNTHVGMSRRASGANARRK